MEHLHRGPGVSGRLFWDQPEKVFWPQCPGVGGVRGGAPRPCSKVFWPHRAGGSTGCASGRDGSLRLRLARCSRPDRRGASAGPFHTQAVGLPSACGDWARAGDGLAGTGFAGRAKRIAVGALLDADRDSPHRSMPILHFPLASWSTRGTDRPRSPATTASVRPSRSSRTTSRRTALACTVGSAMASASAACRLRAALSRSTGSTMRPTAASASATAWVLMNPMLARSRSSPTGPHTDPLSWSRRPSSGTARPLSFVWVGATPPRG